MQSVKKMKMKFSLPELSSKSKSSVRKSLICIPEDEVDERDHFCPDSSSYSPPSNFLNFNDVPSRKESIIKRILNNQDKEFLYNSEDNLLGDNTLFTEKGFSYLSQNQKSQNERKKLENKTGNSVCFLLSSLLIITLIIFIHWLIIPKKAQGTSNAFYS